MNNTLLSPEQSDQPQEHPHQENTLSASEAPDLLPDIIVHPHVNIITDSPPSLSKSQSRSRPNLSPEKSRRQVSPNKSQLDSPGPGAYDPYKNLAEGSKFSIRGRVEYKPDNNTPGPGAYEQSFDKSRDSSPSYKLSKSQRLLHDEKNCIPGPGSYNTPQHNKPGCVFGSESKSRQSNDPTIGPGAHDLPSGFSNKTYSFGTKLKDLALEKKKEIPGPGSYETILKNKSPSYSPGRGPRIDFTKGKEHIPGPGSYQTDSHSKSTGVKIGLSERLDHSKISDTPAPFNYDIPSKISESYTFTIGCRLPDTSVNDVPGPGEYHTDISPLKDRSPNFSLSKSKRKDMTDTTKVANPGPGAYQPQQPIITGPQWKFGSESRRKSRLNESPNRKVNSENGASLNSSPILNFPGPGTYDPISKFSDGPTFSLRGRTEYNRKDYVPGPGSYQSQPERVKDNSPSFRLSKAERMINYGKKDLPGPGTYQIKEKSIGSQWKFGSEKKERVLKPNISLGPGAHDLPIQSETISYSFGTKCVDLAHEKKKEIPGPGSYEVLLRNESPSYSSGKSNRIDFTKEKEHVPGPGSYYKLIRDQLKGSKFSSSIRKSLNPISETPAPGSYELPSKIQEGPSFSLYGKQKETPSKNIPGPGHYDQELKQADKSPAYSVSRSKKLQDYLKCIPGPGSYELKRPQSAQLSFKFGSEAKSLSFKTRDNGSPGPGAYNLRSTLSRMSFSMSAKLIESVKESPGPGKYNPVLSNRSPSYNIGKGPRHDFTREKRDVPGPGAYEMPAQPDSRTNINGPKFSKEKRRTLSVGENLPGPGSYELPSKISEGPLFSIYLKREISPNSKTPGPGHYDTSDHKVRDSSPSFKIGSSQRMSQVLNASFPGPGHYDSIASQDGPLHKIGKDCRSQLIHSTTPGPGSYSLQSLPNNQGVLILAKPVELIQSETPGPGSYNHSQNVKSPAYMIGNSKRHDFTQEKSLSPGPGAYKSKDFLSKSGGIFGKAKKSLLSSFTESPGPGSYNPSIQQEGPTYSISSRSASPSKSDLPGPGKYNPSQATYDKSPVCKIGSSKRINSVKPKPSSPDVRRNFKSSKLAKTYQAKILKESSEYSC